MPKLWLHMIGDAPPGSSKSTLTELALDLRRGLTSLAQGGSEFQVDVWQPFRLLPPPQGELPYIVLLVGTNRNQDQAEYFAISCALALHSAGQAVLIPVLFGGNDLLRERPAPAVADRWATRCGDIMRRVMATDPLVLPQTEAWHRGLVPAVWDAVGKTQRPVPRDAAGPVTVFISYSHRDETLRDDLARHLKLLERAGLIRAWHDRRIVPGDNWAGEIDQHLYTADLILLLLSSDFFASDYCYEIEVPVAVTRHNQNAARTIPIVLRPVVWRESALADFQALPTDGKPVVTWEPVDSAFVNVCEGLLSSVLAWKDRSGPEVASSPAERRALALLSTRKRVLDAALPAEVEVGKSAMLVVMVRTAASGGLRALVAVDTGYGLEVEDVQSKPISLQFPLNEAKKPESLTLTVRVQSPEFSPTLQEKRLVVRPVGDSQPCILMLAPNHDGHLNVVVELYNGDQLITACPIRTHAITTPVTGSARCNIASSTFEVDQSASQELDRAFGVAAGGAEPEVTRLLGAQAEAERLRAERLRQETLRRASHLESQGQYKEALAMLERALQLDPEDREIHAQLETARALLNARQREQSRAATARPGSAQASIPPPAQPSVPRPPSYPPRPDLDRTATMSQPYGVKPDSAPEPRAKPGTLAIILICLACALALGYLVIRLLR